MRSVLSSLGQNQIERTLLIPLQVDVAALSEMDDKDLSELGLSNVNDRKAILKYVFKVKY